MDGVAVHQFQNIFLGSKGAMTPGQLKVHPDGFLWKKLGGGKMVELSRKDVSSLAWVRLPNGFQLTVRQTTGHKLKFLGFREHDVNTLSPFLSSKLGLSPKQQELAISGQNWGNAVIDGNMLSFLVGGKQAFEISIADVSQTQLQGKNDVMLQFHVDDTTGEKDSLLELSFHIPSSNTTYVGTQEKPSSQVFQEQILTKADVGPSGDESVVEFEQCNVLIPRGRFRIELHLTHLRLQGLAGDFKIQYKVVSHIYVLPKANQPHTFVVVTLDTPIRKGNTSYHHLVVQFPNDEEFEAALEISKDLLDTKYKDRLKPEYKDMIHQAFADILKGLSGAKIIRHGAFRSHSKGYSVRTSLKAEEGYLYPLEKAFFFLPKPPILIPYEEIDYVAFERHGAGQSLSSSYFDVVVRLKTDQEHQFRNVQRTEYGSLFDFFRSKNLKILNLGEKGGPSATAAAMKELDAHDDDHFLNRARAEGAGGGLAGDSDEEEDDDFVAEKEDEGSPTESSEGDSGSGSDGDGDDEEGGGASSSKKKRKEASDDEEDDEEDDDEGVQKAPPKQKPASKPAKRKAAEEGGDEEKGKKKRKKKDPDAPKRALSGFMYFSQAQRETIRKDNPGIPFTEVGKVLGEKWKALSAEEKEPYERKAKDDKVRYIDQMQSYKEGGKGGNADD